jgi:glutamate dehydrogenase (NAD(P)+)
MDARVTAEILTPPAMERAFEDAKTGYRAFLVIDSLACGTAAGGVRIREGVTLDEIRRNARVMTWKHRFVGVPNGGAKAGIEGSEDLPRDEKARRLAWFASAAAELVDNGIYRAGPDMGADGALISEMLGARPLKGGSARFSPRFRGSGFYTAYSVVQSAIAALSLRGESLRAKTVAIEGFGSVGSTAARLFSAENAKVVAISTRNGAIFCENGLDLTAILRAKNPLDGDPRAQRIAKEELLRLKADVLAPCGPGGTIDANNAREIAAPLIVCGANCGVSFDAVELLHARGCLVVPDFVANCGGVTSANLCAGGLSDAAIEFFLRGPYRRRMKSLLEKAMNENRPPFEVALRDLPPLRGGAQSAISQQSRLGFARRVARNRFVPRQLLAIPTYFYFARRIGALAKTQSADGNRVASA